MAPTSSDDVVPMRHAAAVVAMPRPARTMGVVPERVDPRLVVDADGTVRILLPGDPAYAEAAGAG